MGPLREAVARMLILAGDSLLREAFRLDPKGDQTLLAETKTMIDTYIENRDSSA